VKSALALLTAVLVVAPTTGSSARGSGLWGAVRRGPIVPVCFENRPCDEPAANVTLVFTQNGREAARVKTRVDGTYRVTLRPGAYHVRTTVSATIGSSIEPNDVRVRAGRRTQVNFNIDTGIR
jgi:hypothetical protein